MQEKTSGLTRWRWLRTCGIACGLLVGMWHIPAGAGAATTMDAPVAMQRSCAGSSLGAQNASTLTTHLQASGAQLSINHAEGPPGTQLTLAGNGWPAGAAVTIDLIGHEANGQFFVGAAGITHATVAPDGSFHTGTFAAPYVHSCVGGSYGTPGSTVLYSAHTGDKSVGAEAAFRYLDAPVVQALPGGVAEQALTPGAPFTLAGLHWEPDVEVTLTAATLMHPFAQTGPDNTPVTRSQDTMVARTDTLGAFQVTVRMPVDLAPRSGYAITATSSGPRFGALSAPRMLLMALPAKMPTLTLGSSEGAPGSGVQMAGTRWVPGDIVELEYCRGESRTFGAHVNALRCDPFTTQRLGEARVGPDGRFQAQVTLPAAARLGVVTIQARVASDVFGLMIYAQAQAFTIVPPTVPWTTEHPLLAWVAEIGGASVLLALALGVWLVMRMGRGMRGRRKVSSRSGRVRHYSIRDDTLWPARSVAVCQCA